MNAAILTDLTRCIGCKACFLACKEINGLPLYDQAPGLSSTTWTTVEEHGGIHVRRQCMHCLDPACVSVCPVAALQKTPEGPVIYEESRCIGCRYCMIACPFGIPRYEWERALPRVQKCVLCYQKRLQEGEEPACTATCPTGATIFGEREILVAEARRRILHEPDRYVDHIYGLKEAGGTSILYLSAVPFGDLGFRSDVQGSPYPPLTWAVLSKIPSVVSVAGALLVGLWWLNGRKELMEQVKHGDLSLEEAMRRDPPLLGRDQKRGN